MTVTTTNRYNNSVCPYFLVSDRRGWAILVREMLVRESQGIKRKEGYRPVERPAVVTTRTSADSDRSMEKPPAFPCFPQARLSLSRGGFLLLYHGGSLLRCQNYSMELSSRQTLQ